MHASRLCLVVNVDERVSFMVDHNRGLFSKPEYVQVPIIQEFGT